MRLSDWRMIGRELAARWIVGDALEKRPVLIANRRMVRRQLVAFRHFVPGRGCLRGRLCPLIDGRRRSFRSKGREERSARERAAED
jgi:hypothetical protein